MPITRTTWNLRLKPTGGGCLPDERASHRRRGYLPHDARHRVGCWQATCLSPRVNTSSIAVPAGVGVGRRRRFHLLALLVFLAGLRIDSGAEASLDSFTELTKTPAIGFILAEVTFGKDGKVWACHVVRSNAPFSLEASTITYVREHWKNDYFAGTTQVLPITFSEPPASCPHWNPDMPPPVNQLSVGDPKCDVKVRVKFGPDGWVQDTQITEPSGVDAIDRQAAIWVKVHWHHAAFANRTVDVPFEFKPPVAPVVHPKKQPVVEEPAAPPAVRVM